MDEAQLQLAILLALVFSGRFLLGRFSIRRAADFMTLSWKSQCPQALPGIQRRHDAEVTLIRDGVNEDNFATRDPGPPFVVVICRADDGSVLSENFPSDASQSADSDSSKLLQPVRRHRITVRLPSACMRVRSEFRLPRRRRPISNP